MRKFIKKLAIWIRAKRTIFLIVVITILLCHFFICYHECYEETHSVKNAVTHSIIEILLELPKHMLPELLVALVVVLLLEKTFNTIAGTEDVSKRPISNIIEKINSKTISKIKILDTFISSFLSNEELSFSDAVKRAVVSGKEIEILIINPKAHGAMQRAYDLKRADNSNGKRDDLIALMESDLMELFKIYLALNQEHRPNFRVFLYNATPSFVFISFDDIGYMTFFLPRSSSIKQKYLMITPKSHLGRLTSKTYQSFLESGTISFDQYLTFKISGYIDSDNNEKKLDLERLAYFINRSENDNKILYLGSEIPSALTGLGNTIKKIKTSNEDNNFTLECTSIIDKASTEFERTKNNFIEKYKWHDSSFTHRDKTSILNNECVFFVFAKTE